MLGSNRMSGAADGAERLHRLLEDAVSLIRRGILFEFCILMGLALLSALFLGALTLSLGADERTAGLVGLFIAIGLTIFAIARTILLWRQQGRGPFEAAAWLDRQRLTGGAAVVDHDAGSVSASVLDAAELKRDRGRFGESLTLSTEAIQQATRFAETERLLTQGARSRRGQTMRLGAALLGVLLANGVLLVFDRDAFTSALTALTTARGLESVLVPTLPEPRLSDIRIDYRFPEYTRRQPRTVVSSTGRIRAVPGTEVTIETRARGPLKEGVVILSHGNASSPSASPDAPPSTITNGDENESNDEQRIAVDVRGRRMRVRFTVTRGGRYRFDLVDETGQRLVERKGHPITLEVDEPPTVRLLEPKESPLEVNERDRLKLVFRAEDDFELGPARVAWRVLGTTREGRQALSGATSGRRRFAGRGRFDLRKLKLRPGDRVAYSVEVLDNDAIGGPKVGASETKELRVYSKKAHHAKVMALELEALDAVVNLLGDNLETPFKKPESKAKFKEVFATVDEILEKADRSSLKLRAAAKAIRDDPLGRENVGDAFDGAAQEIGRRATSMRRAERSAQAELRRRRRSLEAASRYLEREQGRLVGTLERQAVYLSDLVDDQRMLDAEALAKDLRDQQRALRRALEDYQRAPTEEKRQLIAQAIEDIQSRIREIMSELAKLRSEIPQDFVNREALEDRAEGLDAVQRQIEEGNLEGAMRDLDRMLNQTERMLSQLQEGREELQTREYSEITKQAEKLWNDLAEVQERQRDLTKRTERISDQVQERSKRRLGDATDFIKSQLERLARAADALAKVRPERHMPDADLFELTERRIEDGRQGLQGRDFGAAQEVLQQGLSQLETLDRDARRRADQAERFGDVFGMGERAEVTRDAIAKARPEIEEVMKAIRELAPDPSELLTKEERSQLGRFQQEQDALSKKADQIQQGLESLGEQLPIVGPEVRSAVDEARSAMGQSKAQLGQGNAPGALGQERRAMEALERLSEQLKEMGSQSGGGQGGAGVPLPFGQPQGSDREDERGGQGRFNRDRVEIPKPEEYQAPSEFREDILEAAKQGTVKAYKEAVRRYYEELIR